MRILMRNVDLEVIGLIVASVFLVSFLLLIEWVYVYMGLDLIIYLFASMGVILIAVVILALTTSVFTGEQRRG